MTIEIAPLAKDRPPRWCSEPACGNPHFARGWCQSHHRSEFTRYAKHGLTRQTFDALMEYQSGLCGICGLATPVFSVDHDHNCCPGATSCGQCLRGLLCSLCNAAIGFMADDPKRLQAAIDYLTKPPLARMQAGEPVLRLAEPDQSRRASILGEPYDPNVDPAPY